MNLGGKLYYSDTDSIVTDIELPADMVDSKAIGKLKLEYKIIKGYFLSGKTYCLVIPEEYKDNTRDKSIEHGNVIKSKGFDKKSLNENDFIKLYEGNDIKTGLTTYTVTDYSKGSVVIKESELTLHADSYIKRRKIYKDNLWVDTKPLIIKNTN